MKRRFIGGEHYWKPSLLFSKKKFDIEKYIKERYPYKHFCFTGGGYYSLFRIIDDINFKENEEILLPSYLCPTILIPFKKRNIQYRFFRVNKKLEIDIEDLNNKITENTRAIFFINYFGFPPNKEIIKFLKKTKKKGIIIIEDIVQSFFSEIEIIGNYAFNSFRKFLPVDGSVIISDTKIKGRKQTRKVTIYNVIKTIGQFLRYLTIQYHFVDLSKIFLKLFSKAKENYYKYKYVGMNRLNYYILSRINVDRIKNVRRKNFKLLLDICPNLALYKQFNNKVTPIGFPIVLKKNRDLIREKFMKKNVYCPIHWDLHELDDTFKTSLELSEEILTIPLIANYNRNEINYLQNVLEEIKYHYFFK